MIKEEFEGNILVTVSEREVRLWVCNNKGQNIFRLKTMGKVFHYGGDITVMANNPVERTLIPRGFWGKTKFLIKALFTNPWR